MQTLWKGKRTARKAEQIILEEINKFNEWLAGRLCGAGHFCVKS